MTDSFRQVITDLRSKNEFLSGSQIDSLEKSFSEKWDRLNAVRLLSENASDTVSGVARLLISDFPALVRENGVLRNSSALAACLRETDHLLKYISYALLVGESDNESSSMTLASIKNQLLNIGLPLDIACYLIDLLESECISLMSKSSKTSNQIMNETKQLFQGIVKLFLDPEI